MSDQASVAIEPMSPADLEAVLAIDVASFAAHELGARSDEDVRALRAGQLREELARAWSRVLVARVGGGAIVAYLLTWTVLDEIHLLNVAVAPSHRRQRIAYALVRDLVLRAPREGAVRILLEVRISNMAAIALYEALGFTRFNVRAGYYADGEDALEMERIVVGPQ